MNREADMGNKRAREFVVQQQSAADWEHTRTVPRPAMSDVRANGIGSRRMQLIVCPSFTESRAWEVRQSQDNWCLFSSKVLDSWPEVTLLGYEVVSIDSAVLSSYFRRFVGMSVPLLPELNGGGGGADGTTTQLTVFAGGFTECRFQWWSESPPEWDHLVNLVAEMIESFTKADNQHA